MKAEEKTNVMRVLEQKKVPYKGHCYVDTDAVSGVEVAEVLGQDPAHVFKTLVTMGKTKQNYVFVIPVARELDLKKAAKAVGEKSIEMVKSKDLLPLTGYIHGGCSPVGMKKFFKTTIDSTAENCETFCISAGKIGYQVELSPRVSRRCPLPDGRSDRGSRRFLRSRNELLFSAYGRNHRGGFSAMPITGVFQTLTNISHLLSHQRIMEN